MARGKPVHIEKYAVGNRSAQCSQLLIQPLHRMRQAMRKVRLSHIAQRRVVRNDKSLK